MGNITYTLTKRCIAFIKSCMQSWIITWKGKLYFAFLTIMIYKIRCYNSNEKCDNLKWYKIYKKVMFLWKIVQINKFHHFQDVWMETKIFTSRCIMVTLLRISSHLATVSPLILALKRLGPSQLLIYWILIHSQFPMVVGIGCSSTTCT